jgi:hypothetical protein
MTAIRLARAYKRKDLIIKMAGCYHGHSDSLLVEAGSGAAEHAAPSSAGIPPAITNLTVVIPYNDIDAVKKCFLINRGKIAAVLVEPVAANMGVVPAAEGYLQMLRALCDAEEAVLIFDEVITGFRVARGGAQELYGVKADVTCLGKIIGGGLPLAAVGGQAAILDMLAPMGPVYQAGTLSGNPIATAAANATLDILARGDCYDKLEAKAGMLAFLPTGPSIILRTSTQLISISSKSFSRRCSPVAYISPQARMRRCSFRWHIRKRISKRQLKRQKPPSRPSINVFSPAILLPGHKTCHVSQLPPLFAQKQGLEEIESITIRIFAQILKKIASEKKNLDSLGRFL